MKKKIKPATKQEIRQVQFAYDTMEHGVLYSLYIGKEMIKHEDDSKKRCKSNNQRISDVTGASFVTKAYFCVGCDDFFMQKTKTVPFCLKCNGKKLKLNWSKGGKNHQSKNFGVKPEDSIACYHCDN